MILPSTAKDVIKKLRDKYGYSTQQIAKECRLNYSTLCAILNGQKESPETNLRLMSLYIKVHQLLKI